MTKLEKTLIYKPHLLGHELGYTKLTDLHSAWIRYIWQSNESRTLQAHRGSYKTSAAIIIGAIIHTIIKPTDRVLILRKEFDLNVKPIVRELARIYKTEVIKAITKELWGSPLEIDRADSKEISFRSPMNKAGTQPNITGASIYQSLTGQHYDRILTDDIVTLKDRTSHAEREKVKIQYQELLNIVDPGKPICNIGTPWHKNDAFSIMPKPVKYDITKTHLPDFTQDHIDHLRATMAPTLFSANYELKHVATEGALFAEIKYIKVEDYNKYNWICHIDARYSGKDTTAITFGARDGDDIILSGYGFDKHIDDCFEDLKAFIEIYKCGTIHLETNADKGYLAKDIREFHPAVKKYHESMNKHVKIVQFLRGEWPNVKIDVRSNSMWIEQVSEYNEGVEPDDCPDSAASIIRQGFKRKKVISYHTR